MFSFLNPTGSHPLFAGSAHYDKMKPSEDDYVPSHPEFIVQFTPGDFCSSLKTLKAFDEGEFMVPFTGLTRAPKAYTSVQCGPGQDDHVELNSDLVYINHSCEPNVAFDLSSEDQTQWHVRALKRIEAGDTLTFFYPSTEWEMDQPFDCQCGAKSCLRFIQGAARLDAEQFNARGFINVWIRNLVAQRDGRLPEPSPVSPAVHHNGTPLPKECASCGFGLSKDADGTRCGCKPKP